MAVDIDFDEVDGRQTSLPHRGIKGKEPHAPWLPHIGRTNLANLSLNAVKT
jgi:hypothetical protein